MLCRIARLLASHAGRVPQIDATRLRPADDATLTARVALATDGVAAPAPTARRWRLRGPAAAAAARLDGAEREGGEGVADGAVRPRVEGHDVLAW